MLEPVVLIPGLLCDARQFYPQVVSLGLERCVTIAPLGQGERIEEIATDILAALPPRFALMGWDLGALVAMEILRRAPDKVSRIALSGAHPLTETPQVSAEREPIIIKAKANGLEAAMLQVMAGINTAEAAPRQDIIDLMMDMARSQGRDALIRQLRAKQRRRDQQATLRRCRLPAMVLCGAEATDSARKRHRFMADLFHHCEYREIPGAADLPMLEASGAFTAALRDWLRQPLVLR
ncbi:alpha/beta fold hydrolase [Pseudoprimorskyibacter insulae]|uniref:AB hydrolase-1 domain-containing protein n=1 Tax=Pseudoprimorskyibacter insulae TaxID=1695997 RepID=A0A2R8AQR8_9RHOB|nr:alpha/beta hydrolase [Pseudoprimorskyibacter insulae]SPF78402.1 hypothetical protein PRI8871_01004 [Pseudoprimorskyibacter insulae]